MQNTKSLEPVWAYALFGWMLGTLPPAIIFTWVAISTPPDLNMPPNIPNRWVIFAVIVIICSIVGAIMGAVFGALSRLLSSTPWLVPVILAPVFGVIWSVVTGGLGGLPGFVIGALLGVFYAAPFGVLGFLIFAAFYETLKRQRNLSVKQISMAAVGIPLVLSLIMLSWLYFSGK